MYSSYYKTLQPKLMENNLRSWIVYLKMVYRCRTYYHNTQDCSRLSAWPTPAPEGQTLATVGPESPKRLARVGPNGRQESGQSKATSKAKWPGDRSNINILIPQNNLPKRFLLKFAF